MNAFTKILQPFVFTILLFVFGAFGNEAWGQYLGTGTFTKITSIGELTDGYYVITNETDAFLMTSNRAGNYYDSDVSGASNGEIVDPSTTKVWKIETNGSGKTIYSESISAYVGWSSGNSATADVTVSNNSRWTFSYVSSKWTVNNVATPARQLSYNPSSPRFAAYGNTNQHELQLYKLSVVGPSYDVIFDGNDETGGTMANQSIAQGSTASLNLNDYIRTGYVFDKWNTSADGSGTSYADGANFTMGSSNVTLYAQWTPIHDVIFNANGGTGTMANQTIIQGSTVNLNSNTFSRAGYVFANWNTSADGSGTSYADGASFTMATSNVTLFAQWNVYTGPCLTEGFGPSTLGYTTGNVTLGSGSWYFNDASIQNQGGNFEAQLRSATGTYISTPTFALGVQTVTFKAYRTSGSGSSLQVNYSTDGGTTWNAAIGSPFSLTTTKTSFTATITTSVPTIIQFRRTAATVRVDDVEVICTLPVTCTPSASITSFSPTSGPSETLVTITGSGFTGTTAVKFGTTNTLSYTVVDNNTIIAEVPYNISPTETIFVFDADGCEKGSSTNFTFLSESGACQVVSIPGVVAPNGGLIFYEFYDQKNLSAGLISILNASYSPINLSGYKVERDSEHNWHALSGTLQPGEIYVINVDDSPCPHYYTLTGSKNQGFNDNDDFRLVRISDDVIVDRVTTPNQVGYYYVRTDYMPNPTHDGSDWTNTFLTADFQCPPVAVGISPATVSTPFTITTQPTDVTGCQITLSVTSSAPGSTYQWKFNNPSSMTGWLNVNSSNITVGTITGANSATLSITGDVSSLMDYQFYCEVSNGTCTLSSSAAQFKVEQRPIYRSVASGNWSDYTKWEMSNDNINFVTACTYPRDYNSDEVIIKGGTTIVYDLSGANAIGIDKLTIQANGTLELLPTAQLTINGVNAGADLIVEGTLFDRTNNMNSIVFSGTTWTLASTGTIIKSNNGSSTVYRDSYEGGMSTIPTNANWIYRYNGDGNPSVAAVNFFYPNLTFENTTGSAYAWGGVNNSLSGSTGGYATVKGNFNIGVTGSGCIVSNQNFNVQPMLIYGDVNIGAGSELKNSNTNNTTHGTGFEIKGDLIVNGTLSILGGTTDRILKFSGNSDQTISGTGTINLYKVETNISGGNLVLNRNFQVRNELKMVQGHIVTGSNLLELGFSPTQKGELTYSSGYVLGKMKRWFNGTSSNIAYSTFPLGFDDGGLKNRFAKIEFTTAPTTPGSLTTEFIGQDMGYDGMPIEIPNSGGFGQRIVNNEDQGFWRITPSSLSGGIYTARFTGEGFVQIADLSDITLIKRDNELSPWVAPGNHVFPTGTTAIPTVIRTGLTGFSDFGYSSSSWENPLPVALTSFHATCEDENGHVSVYWNTASETNSSHFIIERTRDGINWVFVGEKQAAGQSTVDISYYFIDENPLNGVGYYRLKQVDYDGREEIFGPISVNCEEVESEILVYPNPNNGKFTIEIVSSKGYDNATLLLSSITGKVITSENIPLTKGINQVFMNKQHLAPGTYFVNVIGGDGDLKPMKVVVGF